MGDLVQRVRAATTGVGPEPLPQRLCRAWTEGLEVQAASISLMTHTSYRQLLYASDPVALRMEEIQFTVAQGPCVTASAGRTAVVVRDLENELTPWPVFGALLREELPQVREIYAFPLRAGRTSLGCVDLARTIPGGLDRADLAQAQAAADATATALLQDPHDLLAPLPDLDGPTVGGVIDEVHWSATAKAVGITAAQQHLNLQDALALMRAHAFGTGRTLVEVSADVLDRPTDSL